MVNGWVAGLGNQFKKLVLVGGAAICWTLWTNRNDVVFDNSSIKTYMQVLYRGSYWLCYWTQLQMHEELAKEITNACRLVEATVMESFCPMGVDSPTGLLPPSFCFAS
jgi:hypothetical protein